MDYITVLAVVVMAFTTVWGPMVYDFVKWCFKRRNHKSNRQE